MMLDSIQMAGIAVLAFIFGVTIGFVLHREEIREMNDQLKRLARGYNRAISLILKEINQFNEKEGKEHAGTSVSRDTGK